MLAAGFCTVSQSTKCTKFSVSAPFVLIEFSAYRARRVPAVFLFVVSCFFIGLGHGLMALVQNYVTLMIGTLLTGLSYGGSFAILPYIMNRYYGGRRYGFHLTLVAVWIQLSSLAFSYTSGALYDHFAQSIEQGEAKCYGAYCWSITLAITCSSCIVACGIAWWLGLREKRQVKRYLAEQKSAGYLQ